MTSHGKTVLRKTVFQLSLLKKMVNMIILLKLQKLYKLLKMRGLGKIGSKWSQVEGGGGREPSQDHTAVRLVKIVSNRDENEHPLTAGFQ